MGWCSLCAVAAGAGNVPKHFETSVTFRAVAAPTYERGPPGAVATPQSRKPMNANRNKLALRRQAIRVLTADELRIAHCGEGGNA
jgi:hypothetical protein